MLQLSLQAVDTPIAELGCHMKGSDIQLEADPDRHHIHMASMQRTQPMTEQPTAIVMRAPGHIGNRRILYAGLVLLLLPNLSVIDRLWVVLLQGPLESLSGEFPTEFIRYALFSIYVCAVLICAPQALKWLFRHFSRKPASALASLYIIALSALVITALIYPEVDTGRFGFHSDRDEALDVGSRALVRGDNPYPCRVVSGEHFECGTSGNPIAPLPGALLMAAPFVLLLGASVFQTPFWIALWMMVAIRTHSTTASVATWAALAVAALPILMAELVTGSDLLANSLWVCTGFAMIISLPRFDRRALFVSALLGVMLAGRAHFLLLLPALALWMVRRWGWRDAVIGMMVAGIAFLAVTLPFFLANPDQFAPLQAQQKLREAGGPFAQWAALMISGTTAMTTAFLGRKRHEMLFGCAVTLVLPAILAVALQSWAIGRIDFGYYGWYALSGTPFALLALIDWPRSAAVNEDPTRSHRVSSEPMAR